MFGFGSLSHVLVVLVLALILIGPKQLPEVARTIGRLLSELRRASNMFQDQVNAQMRELDHQNYINPQQDHYNQQAEQQPEQQTEQQLELQPQPSEETSSADSASSMQAQSQSSSDEKKS